MQLPPSLFEQFFNIHSDTILIFQPDKTVLFCNPAASKLLGHTSEELIGQPITNLIPDYILDSYINVENPAAVPWGRNAEILIHHKDGSDLSSEVTISRLELNSAIYFTATIRDVSKRKKFERSLEASEAELRALFTAITDTVVVLDRTGCIQKIAPTRDHTISARLLGKTIAEIYPQEVAAKFLAAIQQTLDRHAPTSLEYHLDREGEDRCFDASFSPLTSDSVYWVARDITERRRTEDMLLRRQQELTNLVNSLPALVYLKDLQGRYIVVNDLFCDQIGLTSDQVMNHTDFEILPPHLAERYASEDQMVLTKGEPLYVGEREMMVNDRMVSLATRKVPIKNEQGAVLGLIGLSMDVSELKQAQDRLQNILELQNLIMNLSTRFINLSVDQINKEIQHSLKVMGDYKKVDRAHVFVYNASTRTV
ncbi:MAG: PAS domain S-box protein, partial [Anaerolineaceae bacterium]|nr:PAS domain S-box protein [Anaerolineaceae bacterium]